MRNRHCRPKTGLGRRKGSLAACALVFASLNSFAQVLVVVGQLNCVPFDVMVSRELAPFKAAYPELEAVALFPCLSPLPPGAVDSWRARNPSFEAMEVSAADLILTNFPGGTYGGWLVGKDGHCVTNWSHFRYHSQLVTNITREVLNLRVSNGAPTWRQTELPWRLQWKTNGNCRFAWLTL